MNDNDRMILTGGLTKICAVIAEIAACLERSDREQAGEPPEPTDPGSVSYEDARAVLAEKARQGYREKVKELLTSHGVKQFSEISDPAVFARLIEEAEEIGNV